MKSNFLMVLVVGALALPAYAQMGLGLVPMRLEMKLTPGSQRTEVLRLSNDLAERLRVRGRILDFFIDDKMAPQFDESYPQESKFSCREWLQVNPKETEMPGKSTLAARYTLRVPPETPQGEYHCGVGYLSLPPVSETQEPMGIRMAVQVVAAFYVIVGNPVSRPALKDLSLKALPNGQWESVALFENQGQKTFRVKGFLELRDADGQKIERSEYSGIPVLPERQQQFHLPLKTALTPGAYILYTQADVGLPEILEGSMKVEVRGQP